MSWRGPRKLTVRIILEDGTPSSVRKVSVSNWNGGAVVCSRSQYPAARKMDEFNRPGVYVLVGPDGELGEPSKVYVGEADVLRARLDQHYRTKDWWSRVIAFSSSDEFFNKAHVKYVEARLCEVAADVKRVNLENTQTPGRPRISEADEADCEVFLDHILLLLPVLGIPGFEVIEATPEVGGGPEETASTVRLYLNGRGALAEGRSLPDGFLVYTGAKGPAQTNLSSRGWLDRIRAKLIEQGVLSLNGDEIILTRDYTFSSPSAAAGVFVGGAANGRKSWRTKDGRTLRDLEEAAVSAESEGGR